MMIITMIMLVIIDYGGDDNDLFLVGGSSPGST